MKKHINHNHIYEKYIIVLLLIFVFLLRMHNISERTFELWDEGWYISSSGSALVFADYILKNTDKIMDGNFDFEGLRKKVRSNAPVPFGGDGKPVVSIVFLIGLVIGGFDQFSIFFEMIIISLAAMYINYLIGSFLFDRRIGIMAAIFFAMSGIIAYFSRSCMPQMIMVLFCLIAFYASLRIDEKPWMATVFGISSALAFFTHPASGPLLVSIWGFVILSICRNRINMRTKLFKIFISVIISALIFIFIAELPNVAFKSQLGEGEYVSYFSNLYSRGKDHSYTIFQTIHQIPHLFYNIWESEYLIVLFAIIGAIILIMKYLKNKEIIILIIPTAFVFIYFLMGISYRFRIFIVIYPFIHLMAGLGFVKSYEFLANLNIQYGPVTKTIYAAILVIIILHGTKLSIQCENTNKESFLKICSGLNDYLSKLPNDEKREVSFYQGDISTWFYYYFTERRTRSLYPSLTKSMVWDWRRKRPNQPDYGDFFITVEGKCRTHRISKHEYDDITNKRLPIMEVPFDLISRCDDYAVTTFKKSRVIIKVFDLKS